MGRAFQHRPLQTGTTQTRLVRVTSRGSEPIACQLIHVDLNGRPRYRALSYQWGPKKSLHRISVDGKPFEIQDNLYRFLSIYQQHEALSNPSDLWIDQISIDQNNDSEKSWQVQMMGHTYQNACEVISWLGPSNKHTARVDWILRNLESDHRVLNQVRTYGRNPRLSGSETKFFEDLLSTIRLREKRTFMTREHGIALTGSCKEAIFNLLENTYWERLWPVQELMLARALVFWWGEHQISWDGIFGLATKVNITYKDSVVMTWENIRQILKRGLSREVEDPQRVMVDMCHLVDTFCTHSCKDVRDKVFGLLGVLTPDPGIKVNYKSSVERVFLDAVLAMGKSTLYEESRLYGSPASELWESYFSTCCKLGREMLPRKFKALPDINRQPGQSGTDVYFTVVAKSVGIDWFQFLHSIPSDAKAEYMVSKLNLFVSR